MDPALIWFLLQLYRFSQLSSCQHCYRNDGMNDAPKIQWRMIGPRKRGQQLTWFNTRSLKPRLPWSHSSSLQPDPSDFPPESQRTVCFFLFMVIWYVSPVWENSSVRWVSGDKSVLFQRLTKLVAVTVTYISFKLHFCKCIFS